MLNALLFTQLLGAAQKVLVDGLRRLCFALKLTKFDFLLSEPSRLLLELRDLLLEFGFLGSRRFNISTYARYDFCNFGANESLNLPLLRSGLKDARIAVAV